MPISRELYLLKAIRLLFLLLTPVGLVVAQETAPPNASSVSKKQIPAIYGRTMELFAGGQFSRGKNGPELDASNLGGWNVSVTDYLTPIIGLTADFQGSYGRAPVLRRGALANDPFVSQHSYFIGPQFRWRRGERFALSERILIGATTSSFDSDLKGQAPQAFGMYPNATKLAIKLGGSVDINLRPKVALRFAPSTIFQRYDGETKSKFGFSTGIVFRFGRDRSVSNHP